MKKRKVNNTKWQMMELPDGITTSDGNWYKINADQIKEYVPGLLKKISLEKIIREADAWVKSADGLSLVLYFILLFIFNNALIPLVISLVFFVFWLANGSAFIRPGLSGFIKLITGDVFLYGISALFLIGISLQDTSVGLELGISFSAIWYGLILFFGYKVGLLRMLVKYLKSKSSRPLVPHEDRVLNMLLIRYGMKEGILTGSVNKMQDELVRITNYHKTRKKK